MNCLNFETERDVLKILEAEGLIDELAVCESRASGPFISNDGSPDPGADRTFVVR